VVELARKDPRIIAITAAMREGTGLNIFAREFPDRFYDVGIAEQHAVNFAAGLATSGLRPVVAIYSTFLQRAYDQLYHDVCLMDLPVIFALDRAGIVSDDGPTHQGLNDLVYLRHMPYLVVMAPKDERELRQMLKSALSYGHPVAIRYPKGKAMGAPLDDKIQDIPLGRSELLKEGKGLLLPIGSMVYPALRAAEKLEKEGISLAVVNARFVKPLDEELILRFAQDGNTIITVEEGVVTAGFGSAVRELLDRGKRFGVRFKSIGLPLEIYPLGKSDQIKKLYGFDVDGLAGQIRAFYEA